MAKQPNADVKEHLEKRGIDPATLSDDVIDKFNKFSKGELKKADKLGEALMADDSVDAPMKISAVH
jgi:hypothetical protein